MTRYFYIVLVSHLLLSSAAFASVEQPSDLPLVATIIGSGSPNYNADRAQSGVLITQGDTRLLVDMGDGVRNNLYKQGTDPRMLDALIFTHHHVDHNADYIPILVQSVMGKKPVRIYGPSNTKHLTQTLLDLYHEDLSYRLAKRGRTLDVRASQITTNDLKTGDTFSVGDIKVSTLEVPHTIETLAYRFDYKQQSIVVTGDLVYTDELGPFAKGVDCLIIDSGGVVMEGKDAKRNKRRGQGPRLSVVDSSKKHRQNSAHLGLTDSALIAKQAGAQNLVYVHFGVGQVNIDATLAEVRKQYAGTVIFSDDLMELDCGG